MRKCVCYAFTPKTELILMNLKDEIRKTVSGFFFENQSKSSRNVNNKIIN